MRLLGVKLEIDGKSVEITRWADMLMVVSQQMTTGLEYEGPTRTALKIFKALDYNPQIEELGGMEIAVADVWNREEISD